jgi:hypothetical protein
VADGIAAGKALRQAVKRSEHGVYTADPNRLDPVDQLIAQDANRLQELVPIRYGRMLASPFAFLRGAAAVMIADIAAAPTTGIPVQVCGDMHLSNFGVYASAERNLVFSINDFDEAYPGPWEWDLKRLVASAVVAGRYLGGGSQGDPGRTRALCQDAVRAVVESYADHLQTYANMGYLDLWYDTITEDELLEKLPEDNEKDARRMLAKAREQNHLQVLEEMTDLVDDRHHLIESPPLVMRADSPAVMDDLESLLRDYGASLSGDRQFLLARYRLLDVAHKVVGVGSVGTRCWVLYLEGKDANDPLFLQVKEARPSVLAPYAAAHHDDSGTGTRSTRSESIPERFAKRLPTYHQGRRVVIGQKLIQGSPDIFLGWGSLHGIHYYVRQLRDMKGGFKLEPDKFQASNLPDYGILCGWALALAHAKSGDAALLTGYIGKGDALADALVTFAEAYADQTERDYDALVAAANRGRIPVERDA